MPTKLFSISVTANILRWECAMTVTKSPNFWLMKTDFISVSIKLSRLSCNKIFWSRFCVKISPLIANLRVSIECGSKCLDTAKLIAETIIKGIIKSYPPVISAIKKIAVRGAYITPLKTPAIPTIVKLLSGKS